MSYTDEDEMLYKEPEVQRLAVDKLAERGWRVDHVALGSVFMSKRDRKIRSMTHYCEVDHDGSLRGDHET